MVTPRCVVCHQPSVQVCTKHRDTNGAPLALALCLRHATHHDMLAHQTRILAASVCRARPGGLHLLMVRYAIPLPTPGHFRTVEGRGLADGEAILYDDTRLWGARVAQPIDWPLDVLLHMETVLETTIAYGAYNVTPLPLVAPPFVDHDEDLRLYTDDAHETLTVRLMMRCLLLIASELGNDRGTHRAGRN